MIGSLDFSPVKTQQSFCRRRGERGQGSHDTHLAQGSEASERRQHMHADIRRGA